MIGRVLRIVGWWSLVAASVASAQPSDEVAAHARPEPELATPWDDDLIAAPQLRPLLGARIEALVRAGTNDLRSAALRATERRGPFALELAGDSGGHTDITQHGVVGRVGVRFGGIQLDAFGDYTILEDKERTLGAGTYGARGWLSSRPIRVLGIDHELGIGGGAVELAGATTDQPSEMETHMRSPPRTVRGRHRYLNAYIHDTIRVIESLDISGGFVFENWKWLTSYQPKPVENAMDPKPRSARSTKAMFSPRVGALYRIDDQLALRGDFYHTLHSPTLDEIGAEPVQPEVASTIELGPHLTARSLEARTAVFWTETSSPLAATAADTGGHVLVNADHMRATGVTTTASWRPTTAWHATLTYTFTESIVTRADAYPELVGKPSSFVPRHHLGAAVTFDDPKVVTVTGAVRYVDRALDAGAYTVVDAIAMRRLTGGIAGYLSIENILDRRYITSLTGIAADGIPRTIAIGLRVDSAKF